MLPKESHRANYIALQSSDGLSSSNGEMCLEEHQHLSHLSRKYGGFYSASFRRFALFAVTIITIGVILGMKTQTHLHLQNQPKTLLRMTPLTGEGVGSTWFRLKRDILLARGMGRRLMVIKSRFYQHGYSAADVLDLAILHEGENLRVTCFANISDQGLSDSAEKVCAGLDIKNDYKQWDKCDTLMYLPNNEFTRGMSNCTRAYLRTSTSSPASTWPKNETRPNNAMQICAHWRWGDVANDLRDMNLTAMRLLSDKLYKLGTPNIMKVAMQNANATKLQVLEGRYQLIDGTSDLEDMAEISKCDVIFSEFRPSSVFIVALSDVMAWFTDYPPGETVFEDVKMYVSRTTTHAELEELALSLDIIQKSRRVGSIEISKNEWRPA